jgi:hypothetical protein
VKFGKCKIHGGVVAVGSGRISTATLYDDDSLGYARTGNESRVSAYLGPADSHRLWRLGTNRLEVFDLTLSALSRQANTDSCVYCLAEASDARWFDDFDADACVVITNPEEFKTRQNAASRQYLVGSSSAGQ